MAKYVIGIGEGKGKGKGRQQRGEVKSHFTKGRK